jgi:seryl-tRNA synthetase
MTAEPENLVLVELRGIRREFRAMLENQQTFARQQGQFLEGMNNLSNDIKDLRRVVQDLRSDVVMLESHNITRHNEILDILRRIESIESEELPNIRNDMSTFLNQSKETANLFAVLEPGQVREILDQFKERIRKAAERMDE